VLRAVLRAFDPATTESRLIITSRFPFQLEGLEAGLLDLPLSPLSPAAQRKLDLRQRTAALSGRTERERAQGAKLIAERSPLLERVAGLARGNPGLQDLIGRRMVLSPGVTKDHAGQVLQEMEAWLGQGALPSDNEVRAFLENLAIDRLIELAGDAGRELLRGLTLFDLPIPEAVADKVARMVDSSLLHLRDLGLVDVHEDLVDHREPAVAANALAAARVAPLSKTERKAVAREVAHDLFTRWGGAAAEAGWPIVCDEELTRLGLLAEDGEIVASCAATAVRALSRGPAKDADDLGRKAIQLLDAQQRAAPWRLLRVTAEAAATSGDGETADGLIARGVEALAQQRTAGTTVDALEAPLLLGAHADRLVTRGKLDEALRILRDGLLPFFERLGDVRSRAVTMGKIADILVRRGELDEARALQDECLKINCTLGDADGIAAALWGLAQLDLAQEQMEAAIPRITEAYDLLSRLDRADGIALVGMTYGQILAAGGKPEAALAVLRRSAAMFRKLGLEDGARRATEFIAQLGPG
jgi:tetratricopeptide (TPR) repeat protein